MKTDVITIRFHEVEYSETLEFTEATTFKGWDKAPEGLYLFSNTTTYLHPWHNIRELQIHATPVKSKAPVTVFKI